MKERLIYLIYTILVIMGFALIFGIIKTFLPSWVYWSSLFLALAGVFWEITKPEKKRYWSVTFMEFKDGHQKIGYGVQKEKEEFDFVEFYKEHPTYNIIFIKEISKKQYEELKVLLAEQKVNDETFHKIIRVHRIDKDVDVIIPFDKTTKKYCFVNLTDNHVCKCRFNTIEEAMEDMSNRKEVINWSFISQGTKTICGGMRWVE